MNLSENDQNPMAEEPKPAEQEAPAGNEAAKPSSEKSRSTGRDKPQMSEEEIEAQKKSRKLAKKTAIMLSVAFCVLLGLNLLSEIDFEPLISAIVGKPSLPPIQFEVPDFEENIMKDTSYLDKIRLMEYCSGGQETLINEEDYVNYDIAVNRMHDFFTAAIAGDLEGYNDCFTEAYHKKNKGERTEPFTMQRIYDMSITHMGEIDETEDGSTVRRYYLVKYKIQKNNGTLRNDMGSDCYRPQVFELVWDKTVGECRIDAVTLYYDFEGIPEGK